MSSVAAEVRKHREAHPELYCQHCLWRVVTSQGTKPCPRHAVAVEQAVPPSDARPCNECGRIVGLRVEVRTADQRLVVCASCAVTIAASHPEARIVANTPPMASLFVCSDGWYSPRAIDAKMHQETLNAEATRFADRVRGAVERNTARTTAPRTTAEARASILASMSPKQRATFERRGIA